jgi:hypothetical protein
VTLLLRLFSRVPLNYLTFGTIIIFFAPKMFGLFFCPNKKKRKGTSFDIIYFNPFYPEQTPEV